MNCRPMDIEDTRKLMEVYREFAAVPAAR
jgi:hypothetical protein